MNKTITLYTIGHSNLAQADFLECLRLHGVRTLVDVRSIPVSRHVPQFNKNRLAAALAGIGISYVYMGDRLGGRPQDPTVYRSGRLPKSWAEVSKEIDYDAIRNKDWFQAGIEDLLVLAGHSLTAVMCAEEDPDQCHRKHLLAASFPEDIPVFHIRSNCGLDEPSS